MANHKSAIKRHRQSLKRRDRNREGRAAVRAAIKDTRQAAALGDKGKATELLAATEKLIAKSASKGLYHNSNASRKISRLAVFVKSSLSKTVAA